MIETRCAVFISVFLVVFLLRLSLLVSESLLLTFLVSMFFMLFSFYKNSIKCPCRSVLSYSTPLCLILCLAVHFLEGYLEP